MGIDPDKVVDPSKISGNSCYIPLTGPQQIAISEWIKKGVDKHFIVGPFDLDYKFEFDKLYIAPMFVVPKPNKTWRTILHLSWKPHPNMFSVNDLLCEHMKTVQYVRFKEVVNLINNAGKGAYIFLIDAQDAYYRVPIQRSDWQYMGIKWNAKYWVFRSLQMGMSSSPKIYTAFADAVEYIFVQRNRDLAFINGLQQIRHYIDDFFGAFKTKAAATAMYKSLFKTMEDLGIATRWEKCTDPHTRAKVLGWIYDTILRMVGVPDEKRLKLIEMITRLLKTHRSDRKSLQQLIGRLQNFSCVIFPGKAFVRRLEAVLHLVALKYNEPTTLSNFVLEDLKWWLNVLNHPEWCWTSFDLLLKHPSDGDIQIYTDASSKIGGGGIIIWPDNTVETIQVRWKDTIYHKVKQTREIDIELLELLMSVLAVKLVASRATNRSISLYNDNPGAASAIRTKAPGLHRMDLQYLIRDLATTAIQHKLYFWGLHCTVKESPDMVIADGLSRFKPEALIVTPKALRFNPIKLVNELFESLINQPLNLVPSKDLTMSRRRAYKILLNCDKHFNSPNITDIVNEQLKYNILKQ